MHGGHSGVDTGMRKPRALKKNASYHVTARANRDETILQTAEYKELFLSVMMAAQKKFRFAFNSFCLLENCIHFIIRPTAPIHLSKIMQWILSVFAMKFNKCQNYRGHVWYDRFKSKIVDDIFKYLDTYIYILKTPIGLSLAACPSGYPFNDLNTRFKEMISDFQPP
jgi:putative transposase